MKLGASGLALAVAALTFGVSVAAAQPGPAPPAPFANPPYKNLVVLPSGISRAELISTMKLFTQSLGVRCTYCHVGEEGKPLSTFDFASDAKNHKDTARGMLRMADRLNSELPGITGLPDARVTCFTCHRGSTKPLAAPAPGAPSTVPPPPPAKPPERG